jgi:hypothetical protein
MNPMKRRLALLFVLIVLVTVAACSTSASNQDKTSPPSSSPSVTPSAAAATKKEPQNPVDAKQISINLPAGWTFQKGDESFGLENNGTPVGALDGLGFHETIDGLLPNGANVDSQEELTGLPMKAVMTKLSMDGQGDAGKRKEYHIFFFLTKQKAVYDLHFNANLVKESEARSIAQTAVAK